VPDLTNFGEFQLGHLRYVSCNDADKNHMPAHLAQGALLAACIERQAGKRRTRWHGRSLSLELR
jgi:hypothetical protein